MKHRKLIATLAAGAAIASQPLSPRPPLALSVNAAMEIAQKEIARRGLAATYHASALYAGGDRRTEGAAFAVIVLPHGVAKNAVPPPRLKLLIHDDGSTTLQAIPVRTRAHA